MNGLAFTVDCVECGGPVERINGAERTRWSVCAVVKCEACRREYLVEAHLSPMRVA